MATPAVVPVLPPMEYNCYYSLDAAALGARTAGQSGNLVNENHNVQLDPIMTGTITTAAGTSTTTSMVTGGVVAPVHSLQSLLQEEVEVKENGGVSPNTSMMLLSIESRQRPMSSMEYAEGIVSIPSRKEKK